MTRPHVGYISIAILLAALFSTRPLFGQDGNKFDIQATIRMTTFASHPGSRNESILKSPNGEMSAFVTSQGNMNTNMVESTLWLVAHRDASRALIGRYSLIPQKLSRINAVPQRVVYDPRSPVIFDVRWSRDSSALYYLAESSTGTRLYRVAVKGLHPIPLSGTKQDVQQYAIADEHVVYSEVAPGSNHPNAESPKRPLVENVEELSLPDILFPGSRIAFRSNALNPAVWLVARDGSRHQVAAQGLPGQFDSSPRVSPVFSVSPNGKYLVRTAPNSSIDPAWGAYVPVPGFEERRIRPEKRDDISPSNRWRLKHYVVTDLQTGKTSDILATPTGDSLGSSDVLDAVWSKDSKTLLLGNTTLPMHDAALPETTPDHQICAAAIVEISSMRASCLVNSRIWYPTAPQHPSTAPRRVDRVTFDDDGTVVTLTSSWHGDLERSQYVLEGGTWRQRMVLPEPISTTVPTEQGQRQNDVELAVHETLNDPPTLWAIDRKRETSGCLWDPNPQLVNSAIPRAVPFSWKDSTGYGWQGVVVSPPNYRTDRRYPLVIQTHGTSLNTFLIDGQYPPAEAARALATAGFVVLQMPYRTDHVGTPQESIDQVEGFRSAIQRLQHDWDVDPQRVGIVAFSRTGFHVEEALVEAPRMFRAAVIADASSYSYLAYRLFGHAETFVSNDLEKMVGGRPTGEGLQSWIQRGTAFNADKVQTPILMEAMGPTSLLIGWDFYTSLKELGKPATLLYFNDGQHVLQQPRSVYMSQDAAMKWFVRWLLPDQLQ